MTIDIYGIKNCDTVKKALAWLDEHQVAYNFHDYKKSGFDIALLERALTVHGWENVLNRKGTTWRGLVEEARNGMDAAGALKAAQKNPSIIRRPMIVRDGNIYFGFSEADYRKNYL